MKWVASDVRTSVYGCSDRAKVVGKLKPKMSGNSRRSCAKTNKGFVATNKNLLQFPFEFLHTFTGIFRTLFQGVSRHFSDTFAMRKMYGKNAILTGQPIGVTNRPRTFVFLTPSRVKSGNCPSTMVVFGLSPVGCKATVAAFCVNADLITSFSKK